MKLPVVANLNTTKNSIKMTRSRWILVVPSEVLRNIGLGCVFFVSGHAGRQGCSLLFAKH